MKYWILLILLIIWQGYSCSFTAVVMKNELSVANFIDDDLHPKESINEICFDIPRDYFFDFIYANSSGTEETDGYGLIYYSFENQNISSHNSFYVTGENYHCHNGYSSILFDADSILMSENSNAEIVMAHARTGTGGYGSHPFTFLLNDSITFSFMHNGNLRNIGKEKIHKALGESWFFNHPSNWVSPEDYDDVTKFIDSELIFHWIMKNIIEENGNIKNGLYKALTDKEEIDFLTEVNNSLPSISNKLNFVLSDGKCLYIFRNSKSDVLSFYEHEEFFAVKTGLTDVNLVNRYELIEIDSNKVVSRIDNFPDFTQSTIVNYEVKPDTLDLFFSGKISLNNSNVSVSGFLDLKEIQTNDSLHYRFIFDGMDFDLNYKISFLDPQYYTTENPFYFKVSSIVIRPIITEIDLNGFIIDLKSKVYDINRDNFKVNNDNIESISIVEQDSVFSIGYDFVLENRYNVSMEKYGYKFLIENPNIYFEQNDTINFSYSIPELNRLVIISDSPFRTDSCLFKISPELEIFNITSVNSRTFSLTTYNMMESVPYTVEIYSDSTEFIALNSYAVYTKSYKVEIDVYPNPTDNIIHFRCSETVEPPVKIMIYNSIGQLLVKEKMTHNNFLINLEDYTSGTYLYEFKATNCNQSGKFVIKK
ncbi:MAG: T9SS type A sorting domain-containing protein [Candidatus Delongbacteria bacterium]|nr:T9SS type A sorting domain-containing protein [Candidatus Delongbacteria bacterium]MBN2836078.1 T9SS type A sorting domain-containing protein [Candidatus Delongbacteria bacterium]